MTGWMSLWTVLLVTGVLGLIGLVFGVTLGAVRELKETLAELSADNDSPAAGTGSNSPGTQG
ncbi:MAG: hypothetical protein VB858_15635 [Planctomycetaceae bacterium]